MNSPHDHSLNLEALKATGRTPCPTENVQRRERGFTFIELLVVVVVLAILAITILPALARSQGPAQRTICSDNLRRLMQATIMYATDSRDYLPRPNWNPPWIGSGWLYDASAGSVPNPNVAPYSSNPELAYQGGQLWPYTKDMTFYRCPLDTTNSVLWPLRANKLSSYVMNGAVCGYGSISTSSWRLSQFKPTDICMWEPYTGNPSDFNDGSGRPNEGSSANHSGVIPLATFGGSVDWIARIAYGQLGLQTFANRAWCNPATSDGR